MERAISVFIWTAAALGFAYGLLFTQQRLLPALVGAVIFGLAALLLVGVVSVLAEVLVGHARRRGGSGSSQPPPGDSGGG